MMKKYLEFAKPEYYLQGSGIKIAERVFGAQKASRITYALFSELGIEARSSATDFRDTDGYYEIWTNEKLNKANLTIAQAFVAGMLKAMSY